MNQPKKSLTITHDCDPITEADVWMLEELERAIISCHTALSLGREVRFVPDRLRELLTGDTRKRIAGEVSGCKRTTAFITYTGLGVQAVIQFKREKAIVKEIAICFAHEAQQLQILWGL